MNLDQITRQSKTLESVSKKSTSGLPMYKKQSENKYDKKVLETISQERVTIRQYPYISRHLSGKKLPYPDDTLWDISIIPKTIEGISYYNYTETT